MASLTSKIKSTASKVKDKATSLIKSVATKLTGASNSASAITATPRTQTASSSVVIPQVPAGPQSTAPKVTVPSITSGPQSVAPKPVPQTMAPKFDVQGAIRAALPSGGNGGQSMVPGAPGGQSMTPASTQTRSGGGSNTRTQSTPQSYTNGIPTKQPSNESLAFNNYQSLTQPTDYSSRLRSAGGGSLGSGAATPTTGGRSSYTGTLSAVGGLGSGSQLYNQYQELTKDKNDQGPVQGATVQQGAPAPVKDTLSTILTSTDSAPSLVTPSIGNQFDAPSISAGLQTQPMTRQTMAEQLERIKTEALRIKGVLDAGMIDEPIEDLPEQLQFIQEQEDPYGIAQAMDNYRKQETNLIDLQKQRIEVMNGIDAITQSYEAIYEDIRENPDMPKGLAQRRLEQLYSKEKGALQNYTKILETLQMQIDDQNQMVNRAFGIYTDAKDDEERRWNRNKDLLGMYMNSGAIAGMSDKEIEALSKSTGMNAAGLKRVRDQKLKDESKRDLEITKLDNGDTVVIDRDTGKIVSNLGGRAPASGVIGSTLDNTGGAGILTDIFKRVNIGGTDKVRAQNVNTFNGYLQSGDIENARKFVETLSLRSMPVGAQNDYRSMTTITNDYQKLLGIASEFQRTNPSLYKTLFESGKSYLALQKDPKWQNFVARTQGVINKYRNEIFGATLTGNELVNAGYSLPMWDKDSFGTIMTKLGALNEYAQGVKDTVTQEYSGYTASELDSALVSQMPIEEQMNIIEQEMNTMPPATQQQEEDRPWYKDLWSFFTG